MQMELLPTNIRSHQHSSYIYVSRTGPNKCDISNTSADKRNGNSNIPAKNKLNY